MKYPVFIDQLNDLFIKNNKKIFIVGGAVRDFINGDEPKDFDLATDASTDEIIKILKGYKFNLQGKAFGVIVVFDKSLPKDGVEIATFRSDMTTGRHPEVKTGVSIEEDVMRRDLTINSIFYDIQKQHIVDLTGGLDDIKNRIIRMVGNPIDRIKDDPLRVQRAVRFSCVYNFKIHEKTEYAIINHTDLSGVSKERIFDEFNKSLLRSKSLLKMFSLYEKLNLFTKIFPYSKKLSMDFNICFKSSYILMLANLFKNESSKDLLRVLINEYKFADHVSKLASKIAFLVSIKDLDQDNVLTFYKKKNSIGISDDDLSKWIRSIHKDKIAFLKYKPVHDSDKLMKMGFNGKALGEEIKRIEKINYLNIKL